MIEGLKRFFRGLAAPGPQPAPPPAAQPTGGELNVIYDRQTAQIIERVLEAKSSCVDVGCHEGSILDEMLRCAPQGTHYAFEPLPHLFAGLKAKYGSRANVRLYELALSEAPGEATFQHVVSNPAYSGLLRRRFDRPHEDVVEIKVKLARLDETLPANAQIHLIKIDVEGAELQVLRGAMQTLRRCRPYVVFEHGQGAADVYGTRPEHVFDLFAECGMKISLMGRWLETGGKETLSREAFVREFAQVTNYYFLAHA